MNLPHQQQFADDGLYIPEIGSCEIRGQYM